MEKKRDLLINHPTDSESVIRLKDNGEVSIGSLKPINEGEPIVGEIVSVHETPMSPYVHECETVFNPEDYGVSAGPSKVSSQEYRKNWDAIFGKSSNEILGN